MGCGRKPSLYNNNENNNNNNHNHKKNHNSNHNNHKTEFRNKIQELSCNRGGLGEGNQACRYASPLMLLPKNG